MFTIAACVTTLMVAGCAVLHESCGHAPPSIGGASSLEAKAGDVIRSYADAAEHRRTRTRADVPCVTASTGNCDTTVAATTPRGDPVRPSFSSLKEERKRPARQVAHGKHLETETLNLPTDGSEVKTSLPLQPYHRYVATIESPYNLRPIEGFRGTLFQRNRPCAVLLAGTRAVSTDTVRDDYKTKLVFEPIHGVGKPLSIRLDRDYSAAIEWSEITIRRLKTDEEKQREKARRREEAAARSRQAWSDARHVLQIAAYIVFGLVCLTLLGRIISIRDARKEVER